MGRPALFFFRELLQTLPRHHARSKRRLNTEADLHTSWMAWEDLQNCPRPLNSMAAHLATSLREKCGWIVDQ